MTTIKEWSDRGEHLRMAARRLEAKSKGLLAEAEYMKATAICCDQEAARLLDADLQSRHSIPGHE